MVLTLADAVEARLIEAEAALRAGDNLGWLATLNHLRQTAWTTIVPATPGPLPDLTDPGPDGSGGDALRVDLLFRERAFWLYLTGHRQGDLRRLVRRLRIGRPRPSFPSGTHLGGGGTYQLRRHPARAARGAGPQSAVYGMLRPTSLKDTPRAGRAGPVPPCGGRDPRSRGEELRMLSSMSLCGPPRGVAAAGAGLATARPGCVSGAREAIWRRRPRRPSKPSFGISG